MLPYGKRWRVAPNSTPDREHRLLWFANGTPGGTPDESEPETTPPLGDEERQRARTERAVTETTGQTRSQTAQALRSPEPQQTVGNLIDRAEDVKASLTSTLKMMEELDDQVKEKYEGEELKTWEKNKNFLKMAINETQHMKKIAKDMTEWREGSFPPPRLAEMLENQDLARSVRRNLGEDATPEQIEEDRIKRAIYQRLHEAVGNDPTGVGFNTSNASTNMVTVEQFNNQVIFEDENGQAWKVRDLLNFMRTDMELKLATWEQSLETAAENLQEVKDGVKEPEQMKKEDEGILAIISKIPLRVYTVEEGVEAVKSVWNAYKEAYKQRTQLRAAALAEQLGHAAKYLPWGGRDIPPILDRELEERNDGIANKYADYLKGINSSYKEIFGPDGELIRNKQDGNRARGVLQYAAGRGWLVDIDFNTKAGDGHPGFRLLDGSMLSFRDLVPSNWDNTRMTDAYSKLITAQNSGKKEESEKYYNRYYNIDTAKDFVHLVDKELAAHNIWAVSGIIKRSIERGLEGEVGAWHAATIMARLESDPQLRRMIPRDWLDQIGQLSIYRSAFVLGVYKVDRKPLARWLESGDGDIRNAGVFGKLTKRIREDIMTRTGLTFETTEEQQQLTHYIAKILAAQTLTIKNKAGNEVHFSIFDSRYNFFRNHEKWVKTQSDLSPGVKEEDPDYFTNISENHWAGERPVAQIFERTGTGEFANLEKAMYYTGHIFEIQKKLEDVNNKEAAENYRREMGFKLSRWIWQSPLGDSRAPGLEAALIKGGKMEGRSALNSLITAGFIDVEPIIRAIWEGKNGKDLARLLLNRDKPDLYKELEAAHDLKTKGRKIVTDDGKEQRQPLTQAEQDEKYWDIVRRWRAVHPNITFVGDEESVAVGTKEVNPAESSEAPSDTPYSLAV